jgi:hypothetical protein
LDINVYVLQFHFLPRHIPSLHCMWVGESASGFVGGLVFYYILYLIFSQLSDNHNFILVSGVCCVMKKRFGDARFIQ